MIAIMSGFAEQRYFECDKSPAMFLSDLPRHGENLYKMYNGAANTTELI